MHCWYVRATEVEHVQDAGDVVEAHQVSARSCSALGQHRCLAESHDVPALSRSCHFRSVNVRLPHRIGTPGCAFLQSSCTETEEQELEHIEFKMGAGQILEDI